MTEPKEALPPQEVARDARGRAAAHWPLLGAIALAVAAAVILVFELTVLTADRSQVPLGGASEAVGAAPVPLASTPFSFLDSPATVADLKFVDGSEKPQSLSAFKGRLVLLNVWATWCLPCRKEMPSLDRLQAKFDPSKLLVLALSIDRSGLPAVRKFYADLGLKSLGIYVDQSGAALHQLGLVGIPGSLLINADGLEIGRKLGPAEWDSPEVLAILQSRFGLLPAKPSEGGSP